MTAVVAKGLARYLNVKNAISVALSVSLTLMVASLELGGSTDAYVCVLILLFIMYLVLELVDQIPRISRYVDKRWPCGDVQAVAQVEG